MSDFNFEDMFPESVRKNIESSDPSFFSKEKADKIKQTIPPDVMLDTAFFLSNAMFSLLVDKRVLDEEQVNKTIQELIDSVESKRKGE